MAKAIPGAHRSSSREETIELNNEVFSLEHAESKEVQRILTGANGAAGGTCAVVAGLA